MGREGGHGALGVKLRGRDGPVLLLQLATTLSLLPLDPLPFLKREHFLVLHTQFPTLQFKMVEHIDDGRRFLCRGEVGKSQTPKDTIVEVVVERVGQGKVQFGHQLHQLFFLDGKGDVLDDNGGGDQFIVCLRGRGFRPQCARLKRTGSEIGERTRDTGLLIEPGLFNP